MITLNLVDESKSDIKYIISKYPDHQQDVTITQSPYDRVESGVKILSRFNGFEDLELIVCAVKALRRLHVREIYLYIPYLLGARSDRQFQEGSTSYLVDVVTPILNDLSLTSIEVLDVHSDVAAACINNLKVVTNLNLVRYALMDIYKTVDKPLQDNFVLVSPDAGASKKIQKLADKIGYTRDIITCSKTRGVDGKLSNTVVPFNSEDYKSNKKDFIIIDDICDGGRTFLNIAEKIKEKYITSPKIYLIVTHGIFSKGLKVLDVFDGIYTTNSIQDLGADEFDGYHSYKHKIKQLNIF